MRVRSGLSFHDRRWCVHYTTIAVARVGVSVWGQPWVMIIPTHTPNQDRSRRTGGTPNLRSPAAPLQKMMSTRRGMEQLRVRVRE